MRFGSLSERGCSLIAVCGSKFDSRVLSAGSEIRFRNDPDEARAAIRAVQRARLVSYIERGILPTNAFYEPDAHADLRDEACIHLILHRGNCFLGAIRCQFHAKQRLANDPEPLFREIMTRSGIPESSIHFVERLMSSGNDLSATYTETSGWLTNPDIKRNSTLSIILPLAVWGLGRLVTECHCIATLRASNRAAATLAQLGGETIRDGESEMHFEDPFYRGPVQLMLMHSRRYHAQASESVDECERAFRENGILISV